MAARVPMPIVAEEWSRDARTGRLLLRERDVIAHTLDIDVLFGRYRQILHNFVRNGMLLQRHGAKVQLRAVWLSDVGGDEPLIMSDADASQEMVRTLDDIDDALRRSMEGLDFRMREQHLHRSRERILYFTGFALNVTIVPLGSLRSTGRIGPQRRYPRAYLPLPQWLTLNPQVAASIENPANEDDDCFRYACESSGNIFDYTRTPMPVLPTKAILDRFVKDNRKGRFPGMYLNVYFAATYDETDKLVPGCEWGGCIEILYCSKPDRHVESMLSELPLVLNLLVIQDDRGDRMHWTRIKNLDQLLQTKPPRKRCPYCLVDFGNQNWLTQHLQLRPLCTYQAARRIFPKPHEAGVYHERVGSSIPLPYTMYADFETFVTHRMTKEMADHYEDAGLMYKEKIMPVSAYGILLICHYDPKQSRLIRKVMEETKPLPVDHSGEPYSPLANECLRKLIQLKNECEDRLRYRRKPVFTAEDSQAFQSAVNANAPCYICHLPLLNGWHKHWNESKLANPCQPVPYHTEWIVPGVTPEEARASTYIGPAHKQCVYDASIYSSPEPHDNERFKFSFAIPVYFHNLRGFDGPLLLREVNTEYGRYLSGIPASGDKLRMWTLDRLRFVDTLEYLKASLEELAKALPKDKMHWIRWHIEKSDLFTDNEAEFHEMKDTVTAVNEQRRQVLFDYYTRKGVYPYEAIKQPEDLMKTSLPPQEMFYSKLRGESVSDADYKWAHEVWENIGCETMADYTRFYLTSDVLLLADVFESFRAKAREEYHLDPVHYMSLPSFAKDACLKNLPPQQYQGGEGKLFPFAIANFVEGQGDLHAAAEEWMRGGVCGIPHRYARANHPDVNPDTCRIDEPVSVIVHYDVTNLYGWAMTQRLPYADYQWISESQYLAEIQTRDYGIHNGYDYMLIVDYDFPVHLHDLMKDYPPAPRKSTIMRDDYSPYLIQLLYSLGQWPQPNSVEKEEYLLLDMRPRRNYHVLEALHLAYVRIGVVCSKIHRVMKYRAARWLKSFVEDNAKKRAAATEAYVQDMFKLMSNSFYGKMMQRDYHHKQIAFVLNTEQMDQHSKRVQYEGFIQVNADRNLRIVKFYKTRAVYKSPIIVGACILDWSKLKMFELWYDVFKSTFGPRTRLLMTDTDSFVMQIFSDDYLLELHDRGLVESHLDLYKALKKAGKGETDRWARLTKKNTGILGMFTEERGNDPIVEFMGLASKNYMECSLRDKRAVVKAKGIVKSIRNQLITAERFRAMLFNDDPIALEKAAVTHIVTKGYKNYQVTLQKTLLSPIDRKFWLVNSIETVPYGCSIAHLSLPWKKLDMKLLDEGKQSLLQWMEANIVIDPAYRLLEDGTEDSIQSALRKQYTAQTAERKLKQKRIRRLAAIERAFDDDKNSYVTIKQIESLTEIDAPSNGLIIQALLNSNTDLYSRDLSFDDDWILPYLQQTAVNGEGQREEEEKGDATSWWIDDSDSSS